MAKNKWVVNVIPTLNSKVFVALISCLWVIPASSNYYFIRESSEVFGKATTTLASGSFSVRHRATTLRFSVLPQPQGEYVIYGGCYSYLVEICADLSTENISLSWSLLRKVLNPSYVNVSLTI